MTTALTTTESLADRINAEHRACEASHLACETLQSECEASAFTGLAHARDAGKLLIKAKRACKKRKEKWIPWIEANCEFTRRTASWYIRVAENWRRLGENGKRDSHLTSREAKKLLAAPKVKAPKAQTDDGEPDETVDPRVTMLREKVRAGEISQTKCDQHIAAGELGLRGAVKMYGPEKPKVSRADQLDPIGTDFVAVITETRKLLAGLDRICLSKAQAAKVMKAIEKLSADLYVIEEHVRACLKG